MHRRDTDQRRFAMFKIVSIAGLALAVTVGCHSASAGLQLQGRNLNGLNLQGISIQGMEIQGMNMQGRSLNGMQIQGRSMQGAPFQDATEGDDRGLHVIDGMRVISISFADGATHTVR